MTISTLSPKQKILSILLITIIGLLYVLLLPAPVKAAGVLGDSPTVAHPDDTVRLLVKWQGEVQIASQNAVPNALSTTAMWPLDWQAIEVPASQADEVLAALQGDPRVAEASPDYTLELAGQPEDPGFADGSQWALEKVGADIAWSFSTGNAVTVAIVDSGIDPNHPDLVGQLVPGYNFIDDNADTSDTCGHGTHVAGIVAAASNGEGVIGLAYQAKLMPVKVINDDCTGSYSRLMQGILYSVEHGARVIVITSGGAYAHEGVREAINVARNEGILVVVAAGNRNSDKPFYPGSFEDSFTVAGTDPEDGRYENSNHGKQIDVSAPATTIYSTYYQPDTGSTYAYMTGTSMAAPQVAGIAALMIAANPDISLADLENGLRQTADDLGPTGWDKDFGWGRVNAWRAVTAVSQPSGATGNIKNGHIRVPVLTASDGIKVEIKEEANGLRLTWTVERPDESRTVVIYRSPVQAFESALDITELPLVNKPGGHQGSYLDTATEPDKTYYYWIVETKETVELAVTNVVAGSRTSTPAAPSVAANTFLPLLATPAASTN